MFIIKSKWRIKGKENIITSRGRKTRMCVFLNDVYYYYYYYYYYCYYYYLARSVVEQHHLRSPTNVSLYKVQDMQLTAGSVRQNFKESVKRLSSDKNGFHFMSSVTVSPAYWKQFLHEKLAMVRQLVIPTYILTFWRGNLRWDQLSHMINKFNNLNLTDEEIRNLTYQRGTKLLNNNPLLVARHFQYSASFL